MMNERTQKFLDELTGPDHATPADMMALVGDILMGVQKLRLQAAHWKTTSQLAVMAEEDPEMRDRVTLLAQDVAVVGRIADDLDRAAGELANVPRQLAAHLTATRPLAESRGYTFPQG